MTISPAPNSPPERVPDLRRRVPGQVLRGLVTVGILSAGAGVCWLLVGSGEEAKSPPAEKQAIRTRVMELHVQDYPVEVTTSGLVQAHNQVLLSAEVTGQIVAVSRSFEAGAYFAAGEVLVELDSRDYKTALAAAEAQVLGAQATLEFARVSHDRNAELFAKAAISQALIDQSLAARSQAEAELQAAMAQLERAQRDLERTAIRAPFSGRVRTKMVGLGQSVAVGTPLGEVFAVDFAEVRLPVSARQRRYLDLPEVAGDPPLDVVLQDAIDPDEATVWRGRIVRTEGTLDEDSLELYVIARIDDPFGLESGGLPLRIGQPVTALVAGQVLHDVVALPRAAVRQLDQIFLVDKAKLTLSSHTIEAIWSDENYVLVRDPSIRVGDLLSTTHLVYAPDGAQVEIIPDVDLGNEPDSLARSDPGSQSSGTAYSSKE